eukprot:9467981-Pyramimonas_sp.AAC.1
MPSELCIPKELLAQWGAHSTYGTAFNQLMEQMQSQLGYTEPVQGTADVNKGQNKRSSDGGSPDGKRSRTQLAVIVSTDTVSAVGRDNIATSPLFPNLTPLKNLSHAFSLGPAARAPAPSDPWPC